jgi:hypothetical protein
VFHPTEPLLWVTDRTTVYRVRLDEPALVAEPWLTEPWLMPSVLAASADGSLLAFGGPTLVVRDLVVDRPLDLGSGAVRKPCAVAFDPASPSRLAVASEDEIRVFDVRAGIRQALAPCLEATSLAFVGPHHLASVSNGGLTRLWDLDAAPTPRRRASGPAPTLRRRSVQARRKDAPLPAPAGRPTGPQPGLLQLESSFWGLTSDPIHGIWASDGLLALKHHGVRRALTLADPASGRFWPVDRDSIVQGAVLAAGRLFYLAEDPDSRVGGRPQRAELVVVDVQSGARTVLHEVAGFSCLDVGGRWLVYRSGGVLRRAPVDDPGQSEVVSLDLPEHVVPDRIRVSPDGTRLVLAAQGTARGLYVVALGGSVARLGTLPRAYPWILGFDPSGRWCLDTDGRVWDLDTGSVDVAVGDGPTANGGVLTERWVVRAEEGVVSVYSRSGGRPAVTWALHAPLNRLGSCLCADRDGTLYLGNVGGFVRRLRLTDEG